MTVKGSERQSLLRRIVFLCAFLRALTKHRGRTMRLPSLSPSGLGLLIRTRVPICSRWTCAAGSKCQGEFLHKFAIHLCFLSESILSASCFFAIDRSTTSHVFVCE